jgi:hypothetical protein
MYVELTQAQMKRALDVYIEEMTIEELEKFVLKVVKVATEWEDMDWTKVKKIVDKQVYLKEDENAIL